MKNKANQRDDRRRSTKNASPLRRSTRASASDAPRSEDPAFAHALAALDEVMRFDAAADGVLSRYFRAHASLGSHARAAIAEGVYAVLRQRLVYQHFAQSGQGPLARRLMLLALTDLGLDTRRATDADEQRWLAHIASIDRSTLPAETRSNMPSWLWSRLTARYPQAEVLALADALNQPAPLDLRVNRLRMSREQAIEQLNASGPGYEAIATPYAPDGVRLAGKPSLQRHPLFENGTLEVQDEGSQLLAHLVAP
ncbi:MAG TPA: SAM-dependent methyltransferase, partial [Burkholderiaceae bacterium]|nr:SAM-dependent methyltransferase [Burkholderiaceae bacterium]